MVSGIDTVPAAARDGSEAAGMAVEHRILFAALFAFLLVAPFVLYPVFLMKVLCFALFASAFNLLLGYGGLLSFGHAAFFGTASYAAAHSAKVWGLTPELAILFGTACGALLGLLIGALAIRRQGIYFAMVTLAFAQMVFFFSLQAKFTGGEDGICSACSTCRTISFSISSSLPSPSPASCSSTASSTRRSARC
jgi:branched-chain amino acid transport system permease protein